MSSSHHGIPPEEMHGKPGAISMGPASSLLTGLTSWWDLDEESGTREDAVGSYDLTDVNTVLYEAGKVGNAAKFISGNNEYLVVDAGVGNEVIPAASGTYTLSLWVYIDSNVLTNGVYLASADTGTNNVYSFNLSWNSTPSVDFEIWPSGGGVEQAFIGVANGLVDEAWNHFVCWIKGTKVAYASCNNNATVDSASPGGSQPKSARRFSLAARPYGGNDQTCSIDLVGFWDRELTADERTTLYNSGSGITYPFTGT